MLLLSMAMKKMKVEKQYSGAKTAESTKKYRRRRRTASVSITQHAVPEKIREKGDRFARDDRSRSRGRKRDDQIMEMPNRLVCRREVRDEREWTREKRVSRNGKAIRREDAWRAVSWSSVLSLFHDMPHELLSFYGSRW
jgi:hypothetical protein